MRAPDGHDHDLQLALCKRNLMNIITMHKACAQMGVTWNAVKHTRGTAPSALLGERFLGACARCVSATATYSAQVPARLRQFLHKESVSEMTHVKVSEACAATVLLHRGCELFSQSISATTVSMHEALTVMLYHAM